MIENCFDPAWQCRNQTVRQWGKDRTGLIEYQFNSQGFRSFFDYTQSPSYAFFGNSIVFGVGVPQNQTLVSHFENSQNYGIGGKYLNQHSVTNLQRFVGSDLYNVDTKIIFFWADRDEPIESMIRHVDQLGAKVLHISSGQKRQGAINLMPNCDLDVSGTHPGPLTHAMWAKTIKMLLARE